MAPSERLAENQYSAPKEASPLPAAIRYGMIALMGVAVAGLSFYLMRKLGY